MTSQQSARLARLEEALGMNATNCRCPDREPFIPSGHVDSQGVYWLTNPDTCPDCGKSTVPAWYTTTTVIMMHDDDTTPIEELPFGGYDRWWPHGPMVGRQEEIISTGVTECVERTRTEPGEWSKIVLVPIADLLETAR